MTPNGLRSFNGYCIAARALILAVVTALVVVVGWLYFLSPALVTFSSRDGLGSYLAIALAIWHPTLLYVAGLWFLQIAAGDLHATNILEQSRSERRLARNLEVSGWLLALGALSVVVTKPALVQSSFFAGVATEQSLHYPTETFFDNFVTAAVIGLLGLLLILVSKVLRTQAQAAEELRQFI